MREADVSSELQALLDRFDEIGGVVDYVVVDCAEESLADEASLHREAALLTLRVVDARYAAHARDSSARFGYDESMYFRLTIDPNKARGRRLSLREFVGPYFDHSREKLILRGRSTNHLNDYFYAGDEESTKTKVRIEGDGKFATCGYAHAFSEPPYRLSAPAIEIDRLFASINASLFSDLNEEMIIYSWSTDWSNYFAAGLEWWGAYLWTVQRPASTTIVGIGASSTD